MLQLHVWGKDYEISIISPSCIASAILLNQILTPQNIEFEIIPSNNTNLSNINQLPILIDTITNKQYNGYNQIVEFIEWEYLLSNDCFKNLQEQEQKQKQKQEKLINKGLINLLINKFEYINQYNLYLNNKNYENYTRKLFSNYLPFPMMYNQPSKYYDQAKEQVKILGLSSKQKVGFFDFVNTNGNNEPRSGSELELEVAQTELFNDELSDEEDIEGNIAISSLHERQLLKKSKSKQVLKESRNSMRCLILINQYIEKFKEIFHLQQQQQDQQNEDKEFGFIFNNLKPSSSEILFYGYIFCLINENIPDRFIFNYLKLKHKYILKFVEKFINNNKINENKFRNPIGKEIPNLINEIKYWIGTIDY
ncbi:mitochondrial outer membrane protein, putative [Candida dubliniensis CD36]|uniref:Sorting assembly machinery (SAM) complex subunit, putative n=1 Tax=Candida dubliniensis (strain CD36 / ATCC MYA-646 / CBS 7987 / NCPF 3949 / NRRL Y-17841) TaxID=573826 RepID=B9WAQ3_CANDC|nr:mitochondrial outer membrane protein, putative [Candida dubliniensis CD36]CAX43473.1 mitochondrial outer membrane protein, putative [Candida dubliniensis CD36]